MSRSSGRTLGRLAAAVFALGLSAPCGALHAQELPPGYEEALVDLLVPETSSRVTTVALVDQGGELFLPVRTVVEHVGIVHVEDDSVWTLEWPPGEWRTTLDLRTREYRVGDRTVPIPARSWVAHDGSVFVSTKALAELLRAKVEVNWENLVVVLQGESPFPTVRAAQLAAERAVRRARGRRLREGSEGVPYRASSGGFAADWGLSGIWSGAASQVGIRGAVGGALLGGAVEAGGSVSLRDTGTGVSAEPFARYTRNFPNGRWLRQLRVGSTFAEAATPLYITGITATNAPLFTSEFFEQIAIRPAVPPGWEYEVYEGDYLVGVSDPTSAEGIQTTIGYGANPVRVRLIGPSGQERTEQLIFYLPQSRLATGEWRYHTGLGACREVCSTYGFADVQYGIARWLSVGAGADRVAPEGGGAPRARPYGMLSVSPLPNLSADLQGQRHSYGRLVVQYHGAGNSTAHLALAVYDSADTFLTESGWRADAAASTVVGGRWISVRSRLRGAAAGKVDAWQGFVGAPVRRGFLSAEYVAGFEERDVLSLRASASPPRRWGARVTDLMLFGTVGASTAGVEMLEAGGSLRPRRFGTLSFDLQWRPGAPPSLGIGYTSRSPAAYSQARTSVRNDAASAYLSTSGGVSFTRGGDAVLNPYGSVGSAGLTGRVFVDVDADGSYSPPDVLLPGASVLFDGNRITADSLGVFRAWNLQAYRVVRVSVDSLSLPDPELAPLLPEVLLRPAPNLFNPVDLALIRTREVEGRLVAGPGIRGVGGVSVEILAGEGEVAARARTFRDGEFYIRRLRPGAYRLRVAPASLQALGARAEPRELPFVVPAQGSPALLQLPPLVLTHSPR